MSIRLIENNKLYKLKICNMFISNKIHDVAKVYNEIPFGGARGEGDLERHVTVPKYSRSSDGGIIIFIIIIIIIIISSSSSSSSSSRSSSSSSSSNSIGGGGSSSK